MVLGFKLLASAGVATLLAWPVLQGDGGVLDEVRSLGLVGGLALTGAFLLGVYFYARALVHALELVPVEHRAASPRSVWWMFVLPYNFVEDFFIVHHVEQSLRATLPREQLLRFGPAAGYGWCGAQILSLAPHPLAVIPSALALVLWVVHWVHIARAVSFLRARASHGSR